MIGHKEQQAEIPSRLLVVNARCIYEHVGRRSTAKLIRSALLTADRDEIDRTKTSSKMRCMINSFAQYVGHSE
jgi:hypothetical protein